jgi:hypothetical protein
MAEFKILDDKAFARSAIRGRKRSSYPKALSSRFDVKRNRIVVALDTGIDFTFDPRRAHGLEHAEAAEFVGVCVEGLGSTLHFPKLDADFSIAGLLEGFLGPMEWARRETSAAASRENGRRGGRPRKVTLAAG